MLLCVFGCQREWLQNDPSINDVLSGRSLLSYFAFCEQKFLMISLLSDVIRLTSFFWKF